MFAPALASLLSLASVSVSALPIHYQASFDTTTFHVSTPNTLHQCTPAMFSWTPTTGPYHLTVTTSGSTADALDAAHTEGEVVIIPHATSASWIVDVQQGQQVTVVVKDANGQVAETIARVVQGGPSHCL